MHVELDDFISWAHAGVRYVNLYLDVSVAGDLGRRNLEVAVIEGCIAESPAEGKNRLEIEIHVSESLRDVVFSHRRKASLGGIDCVRHFAPGIVISEENIGDRCATFLAGPEHIDDFRTARWWRTLASRIRRSQR